MKYRKDRTNSRRQMIKEKRERNFCTAHMFNKVEMSIKIDANSSLVSSGIETDSYLKNYWIKGCMASLYCESDILCQLNINDLGSIFEDHYVLSYNAKKGQQSVSKNRGYFDHCLKSQNGIFWIRTIYKKYTLEVWFCDENGVCLKCIKISKSKIAELLEMREVFIGDLKSGKFFGNKQELKEFKHYPNVEKRFKKIQYNINKRVFGKNKKKRLNLKYIFINKLDIQVSEMGFLSLVKDFTLETQKRIF